VLFRSYTTLDARFQKNAEEQTAATVPADDESGVEDVLVSVEPGTGKILAMAQNRPYNAAQTNGDAYDTAVNFAVGQDEGGSNGFSPGSTVKGITMADWLKNGHGFYENVAGKIRYPFDYNQAACANPTGPYDPRNDNGSTSFLPPLNALQQSYNIPMIGMGMVLGLCEWTNNAKDMGLVDSLKGDITDPKMMNLPILIGSMNATPLTMANTYATIFSGGMHCNYIAINKITDTEDNEYDVPKAGCKRVLDEEVAKATMWALTTDVTQGIARAAGVSGFDVGAKTGTSEENKHLWTLGCVVQVCTAAWVGNAQYDIPLRGFRINGRWASQWYGATLAAPMLSRYLTDALRDADMHNIKIDRPDNKFFSGGGGPATDQKSDDNQNNNSNQTSSDNAGSGNDAPATPTGGGGETSAPMPTDSVPTMSVSPTPSRTKN
jgi:membrane peptidoglycan carboxypeptidase